MASKTKRVTSSFEARDNDEASRHKQSILSTVNQQQEFDQLTSRTAEIPSNKTPEESADETLGESDMDMTVLDIDRLSDRFLSISGKNQVLGDQTEGAGRVLERNLSQTLRYGTPPPSLGITPTTTKLTFGLS